MGAAEPIWDRSHVVRLHLATGRSAVMKRRADTDTFGVELATLQYLDGMPEPVALRLLGADADADIAGSGRAFGRRYAVASGHRRESDYRHKS